MKRRKLLTAGLATSGFMLAGGTLGFYLNRVEDRSQLNLNAASDILSSLKGQPLRSTGSWSPAKIFIHCAKSIEFSMIGFPIQKSDTFKSILGRNAFATFASLGKMTHGLDEIIPGEGSIDLIEQSEVSDEQAIDLLLTSMYSFQNYQGNLKQHFAYGHLSRTEYELAHVMHFYNHLAEISV